MEAERVLPRPSLNAARWALLVGNFVIGCGVMAVAGTLNDLTASLDVSVAKAGHLIAVASIVMGFGAPLLATIVTHIDRRRLLALSMLWYALGHALCALAPNYEWLMPLRALTVLSAAVFTPQAAATIGFMSTPAHRGRAITFVFMGWALASVLGMPLAAWVGERLGWRVVMGMVCLGSLLAAWLVFRYLPRQIKPPALSMRAWGKVLRSPLLMGVVLVTGFQSAGQMTMTAFCAPYFKHVFNASAEQVSFMFAYFGVLALCGNLVLNRVIDRFGPARAVTTTLSMILLSLLAWPLAPTLPWLALVMLPWALSGFATNSGQQARLSGLSPRLAPALLSLNTSAIYLGHAVGASGGGWVLSHHSYAQLHWPASLWVGLALCLSFWMQRVQKRQAQRGFSKNT